MESPQKHGPTEKEKVEHTNFLEEQDEQVVDNQKHEKGELYYALPHTILADTISNRQFFKWQLKITIILFFVVLFLKALPSPLITNTIENDPQVFTKELCEGDEECSNVEEGYESIIIKKVNSFQRQLKYFVKLNYQKFESLSKYFKKSKVDLNDEITWIEIFAYRNGQTYGQVLYEKSGEDIYEILFDNQALIFIGQIHVLQEQSYMIKIYKLIKTFKENIQRQLEAQQDKNETNIDPTPQEQNKSSSNQQNYKQIKISVPLTVQLVRYSQFYTAVELIIRYVTLLVILYVRAETINSPAIFHYILILTSNPLIFIQIAFPATVTNIISIICSSTYIVYLSVFLYYCHRKLRDPRADIIFKTIKLIFFVGLWVASIMRQLHLVNQTKIQFFQYILMVIVVLPLFHHLWKLYFIRSKTILHRNMLFIVLTLYFLLVLFFSGYLVNYGWKKISSYLIVQIYGCELCFLTSPYVEKKQNQQSVKSEQIEHHINYPSHQSKVIQHQVKHSEKKEEQDQHLDTPQKSIKNEVLYVKVL